MIYQSVNLERVKVYDLSTLQHVVWITIENNGNRVQQHPEMFEHGDGGNNYQNPNLPEPKSIKRQHSLEDTTTRHMVDSQIPCAPTLQRYERSIINNIKQTVKREKCVEMNDPKKNVENLKISFLEELKLRLSKIKHNEN